MKSSTVGIVAVFAVVIVGLALLRFHPWTKAAGPGTTAGTVIHEGPNAQARQDIEVGFLPVTCHLTCPVTDFASKTTTTGTNFSSHRFTDFPTVVDALKSK